MKHPNPGKKNQSPQPLPAPQHLVQHASALWSLVKGVNVPEVSTPPPSTADDWAHCVATVSTVLVVVVVVVVVVLSVSVTEAVAVMVSVVVDVAVVCVVVEMSMVVVAVSVSVVVVVCVTDLVLGVTIWLHADDIKEAGKGSQLGILPRSRRSGPAPAGAVWRYVVDVDVVVLKIHDNKYTFWEV
jgi:hypothetical protein